MALAAILLVANGYAQTDSTIAKADTLKRSETDTIRVGNFVIVKKNKSSSYPGNDNDGHSFNIHIGSGGGSSSSSRSNTKWPLL